ncbi:YlaI family protein [Texcoconibacillus texcoconensis]|uniref:Uncharacterized protein YlaI n=1 Tax=Texcoconibacillus texcoconensis TaxID=1095777 RepID=A0A840QLI3_9BACI|nr:YlaI family protein [Texcoconibacillus texcoconensis]MBB5172223.1 uncharacterized protein YlaI [Texcoconibacillus texcoconensis]
MRVKCVICDNVENIDDDSPLAKKLRNRPIHTYMCPVCHERIRKQTEERTSAGQFTQYGKDEPEDDWF